MFDPHAKKCARCGLEGAPICFDCFMGRPFERNVGCRVCGKQRPIVRMYLNGAACDSCAAVRVERAAAAADAAKKASS